MVEKLEDILTRFGAKVAASGQRSQASQSLLALGNILQQASPRPARVQFEAATRALKHLSRVQQRLLVPPPAALYEPIKLR